MRAGVVKPERLLEYRWSSLPWLKGKERPACLAAETVLAEAGGLPDSPAGWRRYLRYLEVLAEEEARLREKKFGRLSRGWSIGSAEFKGSLKKELTARGSRLERFEFVGADREAQRELRAEVWEERLRAGAKALGVRLEKLPAQRSAPEKVKLAALLKLTTSVANGWLAMRLGMGQPASVSQYVRRFRLAGGRQKKEFQVALTKITT